MRKKGVKEEKRKAKKEEDNGNKKGVGGIGDLR